MRHKFLDAIIEISLTGASGHKHLSHSDEVFRDHFPGFPVLPGAMMVETASQLAEKWVVYASQGTTIFVPLKYERFKFYQHAKPGDKLTVSVEICNANKIDPHVILSFKIKAYIEDSKLFDGNFSGMTYPLSDFTTFAHAKQDLLNLGVIIV